MMTAKIFENGRSQAVRIPKEYRFSDTEVTINKIGDIVILAPKTSNWETFMQGINMFSDDVFENGRSCDIQQKRDTL